MTSNAPGSGNNVSQTLTSCNFPVDISIHVGIFPRQSMKVCMFTAAFVRRKGAHGKTERHISMVVESSASTVLLRSTWNVSFA